MKKITIISIGILLHTVCFSQSCLPEGIIFTTQSQIDNFQFNYPNCTEIEGDITISGEHVSNLIGLNVVTSIGGDLRIFSNAALTSLTGLEGLTSIEGDFDISFNDTLTNLSGLDGLASIGSDLEFFQNPALINLTGLEGLTSIGGNLIIGNGNAVLTSLLGLGGLNSIGGDLKIYPNAPLANLTGLDGLSAIGGDLSISYNDSLINLTGLEGLTSVGADLYISYNYALNSLTGLDNLDAGSINNLYITDNNSLSTCEIQCLCNYISNPGGIINIYGNAVGCNSVIELANACGGSIPCLPYGNYYFVSQTDIDNFQTAFPNCTELQGNVIINGNDITILSGLENLTSVEGYLRIYGNDSLAILTDLDNLTSIGDYLSIHNNSTLTSLIGLEGLISVGGMFYIGENPTLTCLTGLENITSIAGYLRIEDNNALTSLMGLDNLEASSIAYLQIFYNDILSNCDVQSICDYLAAPNGFSQIFYNATGCNSQQEVEDACFSGLEEITTGSNHLNIYPNPTSNRITIDISDILAQQNITTLTICNVIGQQILQRKITEPLSVLDISYLNAGIYFIEVLCQDNMVVKKLVVN